MYYSAENTHKFQNENGNEIGRAWDETVDVVVDAHTPDQDHDAIVASSDHERGCVDQKDGDRDAHAASNWTD
jgi:hypothetical protein